MQWCISIMIGYDGLDIYYIYKSQGFTQKLLLVEGWEGGDFQFCVSQIWVPPLEVCQIWTSHPYNTLPNLVTPTFDNYLKYYLYLLWHWIYTQCICHQMLAIFKHCFPDFSQIWVPLMGFDDISFGCPFYTSNECCCVRVSPNTVCQFLRICFCFWDRGYSSYTNSSKFTLGLPHQFK